jgi:hypothetical protein
LERDTKSHGPPDDVAPPLAFFVALVTFVKWKRSDMLREQGIECARRTVAKYREALRIAPANLRKTL